MYDGESLGTALAAVCTKGTKVLIPRAKTGNPELVRELLKAGALVDDVATYETIYVKSKLVNPAHYLTRDRDCVVFTSSSTVKGFVQAMPEGFDLSKVKAACIGQKTAETAKSFGMCSFTAEQATMDSLLELVIRMMKDPAVG